MVTCIITRILLFAILCQTSAKIPCHLVWVEHAEGIPAPEFMLATIEGSALPTDFIARCWKHKDKKYVGGRMEGNQAYISINGTAFMEGNYEVLTNPNGCKVRWSNPVDMEDGEEEFKFRVDDSVQSPDATYIGRGILNSRLLAGEILGDVLHLVPSLEASETVQK